MTFAPRSHDAAPAASTRAPWRTPTITDLPKLTELTLSTGPAIPGGGGGGSTVIP